MPALMRGGNGRMSLMMKENRQGGVASHPGCASGWAVDGPFRHHAGLCPGDHHLCDGDESRHGFLQELVSASLLAEPWWWRKLRKTLRWW